MAAAVAAPRESDPLVREAQAAEGRDDPATALKLYLRAEAAYPRDAYIQQKIAKQYSDLSEDFAGAGEKRNLCTAGLGYALRATEFEPNNAVNVISIAICYGKLALLGDTRTKIEDTRQVKAYAERALALDPHNALAHFVLGRWHREVASHNSAVRFMAGVFFGRLPPASLAEAVAHLRRAAELEPESPLYHVELGFALQEQGDTEGARTEWARAVALKSDDRYEAEALQRAKQALEKSG